jgi:hypothetical protein
MAENIDPNTLAAIRELGENLDRMNRGSLRGFERSIDRASYGLGSLAQTVAGQMTTSATNFSQQVRVLDATIGRLTTTGKVFTATLGILAQQTDALVTSFTQLSQIGALGARGLSGLNDNFLKSGMTLEGYSRTVASNAGALGRFAGTVGKGADAFADITGQVVAADKEFDKLRLIGYNADSMGEATAAYVGRMAQLGLTQNKTNADLAKGARDYMFQLDELSRVTGMSRRQIEDQQAASRNESQFRATLDDLVAQGKVKEAQQLEALSTTLSQFKDPALAKGVRDLASGNTTSIEAQKVFRSSGGRAAEIMDRLTNGQIDAITAQNELRDAMKDNIGVQRSYAKAVGDGESQFISYATQSDFINQKEITQADVEAERNKAIAAKGQEGYNALNAQVAQSTKQFEQLNRSMQALGATALPLVISQTQKAAQGQLGAVQAAAGVAGGGTPDNRTLMQRILPESLGGKPAPAAVQGGVRSTETNLDQRISQLNTKPGAGSTTSDRLVSLAEAIQAQYPDARFTAFNDMFHQRERPNSAHVQNRALDFSFSDRQQYPTTPEFAATVVAFAKSLGFSNVIDEYSQNRGGTGPHFHAEISARNGFSGLLSGPQSGYRPNIVMHGDERLSIQPKSDSYSSIADMLQNMTSGSSRETLDKLDELVNTMKTSVGIQQKILQSNY